MRNARPGLPIYTLTDFDPDGIAIALIYRYGSTRLAHEHMALHVADVRHSGLASADLTGHGSLRLTLRDRRLAISMLQHNPYLQHGGSEATFRRELQRMLMLGLKAEIETLAERPAGIHGWLQTKFSHVNNKTAMQI